MNLATALAGQCRATGAALAAGLIDVPKARAIADGCRDLDPATAAEVETKVLAGAPLQTTATVKRAVRKAVISADPIAAQQRAKERRNERGVWLTPLDDGMAALYAVLAAEDALTVHNVLSTAAQAAKAVGGDTRTTDQLRADYLLAPFHAAMQAGELAGITPIKLAKHRGRSGEVILTVPASVLMGVSDAPGELTGYGPVTADVARVIAEDCTWRRVITDPVDGTFLAADTKTYRPSSVLARHVELRDQSCVFLGCPRPAARCHLDHSDRYPKGGTCHDNLGPLCEHHHIFKHALDDALAGLKYDTLHQPHPGTFVWTMPTGHSYVRTPTPIGPPIGSERRVRPIPIAEPPPTRAMDDDPPPF